MDAVAALLDRQPRTLALLRAAGILPILTVDSIDAAKATCAALLRGGLHSIELTLRTPVALDAIAALKRGFPELVVGAGTVIHPEQVRAVEAAGADFIVTPGTSAPLREALASTLLPVVAGAATPSEMLALAELGFRVAKFFPAAALGGTTMLKALQGPLPHFSFCPTGGITEASAPDYLALPNVACVGGSWMLSDDLAEVTKLATRCRALVDSRK
jgi:2-dehydro-3-deoxyphosphogluconate aldolase/(4S)-4-hydroxy-2-oxoglutarate aldolase